MDKSKQASRARERRLRAKYRKNIRVAIIICLILGLAGGFVAGRITADKEILPTLTSQPTPAVALTEAPTDEPIVTPIPTAEPTEIPTAEPTEAPTAEPTEQPVTATQAPTTEPAAISMEAPTAAPTAEVTAEPTADTVTVTATEAPVEDTAVVPGQPAVVVVPFGETQVIPVQMLADGSPRKDDGAQAYETVNFALRINEYMGNDYYVEAYGSKYKLDPGTAGVEFELMVQDYMGDVAIDPNKLLRETGVETNDGNVSLGFQFYDAAIAGSNEIAMTTNVPMMIYKRYTETSAQPLYLTATVYSNGAPQVYKFELGVAAQAAESTAAPEATEAPVLSTMRVGDTGDSVKLLQEKLIEAGYLTEGSADGDFGNKTAEAVKKAQAALDLEVDGIAGPKFLAAFMAN